MNATKDESLKRTIPAHQTRETVFTCRKCLGLVVDSQPGRQAHKDRLGHWPEERKRA